MCPAGNSHSVAFTRMHSSKFTGKDFIPVMSGLSFFDFLLMSWHQIEFHNISTSVYVITAENTHRMSELPNIYLVTAQI